jgi:hypothetical protein
MLLKSRGLARAWSMEEVRRLCELAAAGVALETIAARLRRTPSAIRNKAGMHGISLRASLQSRGAFDGYPHEDCAQRFVRG